MSAQEKALSIDIPVKLNEVKIVFSIASLSFEGDLPALDLRVLLLHRHKWVRMRNTKYAAGDRLGESFTARPIAVDPNGQHIIAS